MLKGTNLIGGGGGVRAPVVTTSSSGEWEGSTSGYTLGSGTVIATTVNKAIRVITKFSGDVTIDVTAAVIATPYALSLYVGFYDASEDSSFDYDLDQSLYSGITNSWFIRGHDGIHYGSAEVHTVVSADNDVYQLKREGDTFRFYINTSLLHTFSQTFSGDLRIAVSNGNGFGSYTGFSWTA